MAREQPVGIPSLCPTCGWLGTHEPGCAEWAAHVPEHVRLAFRARMEAPLLWCDNCACVGAIPDVEMGEVHQCPSGGFGAFRLTTPPPSVASPDDRCPTCGAPLPPDAPGCADCCARDLDILTLPDGRISVSGQLHLPPAVTATVTYDARTGKTRVTCVPEPDPARCPACARTLDRRGCCDVCGPQAPAPAREGALTEPDPRRERDQLRREVGRLDAALATAEQRATDAEAERDEAKRALREARETEMGALDALAELRDAQPTPLRVSLDLWVTLDGLDAARDRLEARLDAFGVAPMPLANASASGESGGGESAPPDEAFSTLAEPAVPAPLRWSTPQWPVGDALLHWTDSGEAPSGESGE